MPGDDGLLEERKTFCRLCNSHCGMIASVDSDERLVAIRPDKDDLLTDGFACYKGLQAPEAHGGELRIPHPMKRMPDGSFVEIDIEQALDEIADKLREIVARDGPDAVGTYRGSGAGMNAAAAYVIHSFLQPLGTRKIFSPTTIDQSAKLVAADRIGSWEAGRWPAQVCDVQLLIGVNPMLSLLVYPHSPMKQMKEQLARGLKVLVIDPRRTETTRYAHLHLQPLPGEDSTLLAGMIRLILERGWEDEAFVAENVAELEALREAVEPFTPDYVARRTQVPVEDFVELTRVFAHAKRGHIHSGTGANMGPHSNLVEHLVTVVAILCGCYRRTGDEIENPGVLQERRPLRAQVVPAQRAWETGYKSRIRDYGMIWGELPTGIMADEILEPGPDRIRAFFCHGGNVAVIVPDQAKVVKALKSLELLVTVDVHWNPTCELSHYVLPTLMQYERPDLPCFMAEFFFYDYVPFTRYTPAVAKPPKGMKVYPDEYIFWGLARRLGVQMNYLGSDLDMTQPPRTDDLLRIAARHSPIPFEELQQQALGVIWEGEKQYVQPRAPDCEARFAVCPEDVADELRQLAVEPPAPEVTVAGGLTATHRFMVRRHRLLWNSTLRGMSATRRRAPYNTAHLHPQDLEDLGVAPGELVRMTSSIASVDVVAAADPDIRRGTVSMAHGFGVLPGDTDPWLHGASANLLISTRAEDVETINAMPRMSAFPVHITRADRLNSPGGAERPSDSEVEMTTPA
jgi:anaerobic selenocysteine-containing dehydrogenase